VFWLHDGRLAARTRRRAARARKKLARQRAASEPQPTLAEKT
jgi:hypothetical protein